MAQEDKGLVLRGLILLCGIGVIVAIVLGIIFWRSPAPPPPLASPPEHQIPAVIVPPLGGYPSGVPWIALASLRDSMPSAPGWNIRYNAATTLARRGSSSVPWHSIREMLDEKQQMRNQRLRLEDGRDVYDEAAARAYMLSALKAVAAWHEKRKAEGKAEASQELREIYTIVDGLADSPFVELKLQADKARATFFR
jgi:hypothetical protein